MLASRMHTTAQLVQVVPEGDLLTTATRMAEDIAKRRPDVVKLVKDMQHKGQAYDVAGALKYELDIAAKAYEQMASQPSSTQKTLSSAFAGRDRSKL
jgi:enoyl-CoA hydratase/carnithine racemase